MMKRLFTIVLLLSATVGASAAEPFVVTKATTLSDITPWQGADVSFQMSEDFDMETFSTIYAMGSLTLEAPASPKWQIGRFTLPVSYYDAQTNYSYAGEELNFTDVFVIGSFLNKSATVEANAIEVRLSDAKWNVWTVFSVPFDVNFSDIQGGKGNWVIRRYDGANRAAVQAGETWVDVKPGEMLHAYEAYIFQRDYNSLWESGDEEEYDAEDYIITLPAAQTANKQNIFAAGDVVVPLKKYPAEMSQNADWNFVGNPYPCYYDLRGIKEHVTIYIWDDSQEVFRTFDTQNDNGFVLAPCQGFFVQASGIDHLTFQASGRRIIGKFQLPAPDDDEDDEEEEVDAPRRTSKGQAPRAASATFDPENPGDPGANYYNALTGEAYFDLFRPSRLGEAEQLLLESANAQYEDVKIVTVVAPMSGMDLFFSAYSHATRIDLGKSSGFTDIPAWAFTYMTKLKELILPSCVRVIDGDAFLYTSSIERLDIYATTPPSVDSKTFRSFNKENCMVRVPNDAVAAYKAADYWKDFTIMPLEGGGEELQSVTLVVQSPDGQDLTDQCSILWHDADNQLLGVGSTLSAQPVGSTVTYSVGLPSSIANLYVPVPEGTYTVQSSGNVITVTLEATGVVDLGSKQLLGSSGVLEVTFVASDSEAPTVFNSADLVLTIYNKVSGQHLTDFVLQYPNVTFEQTQLEPEQVLVLVATSRNDLFQSAQTEVTVDETGTFRAGLTLKEWGLACITCTPAEGVTDIMALVFDQNGKYVARYAGNSTVVRVKDLKDGTYKVVLMQQNPFVNAIASLSDLQQTELREGEDYALLPIQLTAGTTSQYEAAVPALGPNSLNNAESYIATNDPEVNIATIATLKAKVVFTEELASQVSNLQLIVDIPDGMQFVENSVISVGGSHQLSGQRLVIPCQQGEQVRWCLTSDQSGQKTVTAMVQYILGGQQYLQPLGSAAIEVMGIALDVATTTNTPQINVQGTAFGGSHVTIYDGRAIVAQTTAKTDGSFSADITLNPALDGTHHKLYADIETSGQPDFSTETSVILYDTHASVLNKVSMLYQNQRLTWNELTGALNPGYYSVNPELSSTATFIASFINPKPDCILDPYFEVTATDGSHRFLDATWDQTSQLYTAVADYPETYRLPTDVKFLFTYCDSTAYHREEIFNAEVAALVSAHNQLVEDIEATVEVTAMPVEEDDRLEYVFKIGDEGGYRLSAQMEDYDRVMALQAGQQRPVIRTIEDGDTVTVFFIVNNASSTTLYFANPVKHEAYSETVTSPTAVGGPRRITFSGLVDGAVSGIKDFFAPTPGNLKNINEKVANLNGRMEQASQALEALNYIDEMQAEYDQFNNDLSNRINVCQYLLLARCPNGDLRVPSSMYGHFQSEIRRLDEQRKFLCRQMQGLILSYARALENAGYKEIVKELGKFTVEFAAKTKLSGRVTGLSNRLSATGVGTASEFEGFINDGINGALDAGVEVIADQLFKKLDAPTDYAGVRQFWESWVPKEYHKISMPLTDLRFSITASYEKCKEEEIDRPPVRWAKKVKRVRPIVDPSGYVYEGIEDNRVEGVTATIYYKENESATEQLWDAAEFGQENPLTTDAAGLYMWNVPQGLWQVRFSKDGYQPTQTEWLPVPPPQLEIAVPMTQTAPPAVTAAAAYTDAVSLRFSQFMQLSSLSDLTVSQNSIKLQGTLEATDAENGLASAVRFLPTEKLTAKDVQLTVPASAKSYSGTTLPAAYTATLEVQHTIEGLLVQDGAAVEVGQTGYVSVTAYPAVAVAGRTLRVSCSSPIMELAAATVAFDNDGQAMVPLRGLLPGSADVTFGVGDLEACVTVEVKYHILEMCSRPVATVVGGSVAAGTQVELFSATDGATIYYTTDGSCPCDEAARQRYTGPITILSDVTIQAIAVCDGMMDSEVTTLTYSIATGISAPEAEDGVEAGERYYDLAGQRQLLPRSRGIYVHVRRTPAGLVSRKVCVAR